MMKEIVPFNVPLSEPSPTPPPNMDRKCKSATVYIIPRVLLIIGYVDCSFMIAILCALP